MKLCIVKASVVEKEPNYHHVPPIKWFARKLNAFEGGFELGRICRGKKAYGPQMSPLEHIWNIP